jgi:hypothetical protein
MSVSRLDCDLHGVGRTLALAGHVLLFVVDDDEPPESGLRPKMSALGHKQPISMLPPKRLLSSA